MIRRVAAVFALLALSPLPAAAQVAPVEVKFVGTITGSAADTLMINGQKWTGPLPDFPYVKGDQITVSFMATPDGYKSPTAVDGIYRYSVVGRSQVTGGAPLSSALIGSMDVSGPIAPSGQWASSTGLVLVFDSKTNSYSLEMPTGQYSLFEFDGPGYQYDPTSNSVSLTSTTRQPGLGCGEAGSGCFGVIGGMTNGAVDRAPVFGTDGSTRGFWSMLFSGDWFVNGTKQGGGSTQVPEPGQLSLFALALAVLAWRLHARQLRRDQNNRA